MNVGQAASEALVALLETKNLTRVTDFYPEHPDQQDADDAAIKRALPSVLCFFTGGEEYPPGFGNFNGDLHCRLQLSSDDTTEAVFDATFKELFEAIYKPTFIADINAATNNFTVFGFTAGASQGNLIIDGRIKYKEMIFPVNCTPYKVS